MSGPDFEKSPLIPAIAQDEATGTVLMLAYMNAESYAETLQTRRVCYWSRSRGRLWRKGEDSGNVQHLKSIYYDCDGDTILVKVEQVGGAACHKGFQRNTEFKRHQRNTCRKQEEKLIKLTYRGSIYLK